MKDRPKALVQAALVISLALELYLGWRLAVRGLLASESHGGALIYQYYELAAIAVFALCQGEALRQVCRGSPAFFGWAVPPALFAIAVGVVTWARFDVSWLLFTHTARGALLLGAAMVYLRTLEDLGETADPRAPS